MHLKRSRTTRVLITGLVVLGATAGTAQAAGPRTVEPLNQYTLSGKVNTDELARAGFDVNEARRPGGKLAIVATPSQAQALAKNGATVGAPQALAKTMAAPSSPLTDPTHGYDVFRPWSLK